MGSGGKSRKAEKQKSRKAGKQKAGKWHKKEEASHPKAGKPATCQHSTAKPDDTKADPAVAGPKQKAAFLGAESSFFVTWELPLLL